MVWATRPIDNSFIKAKAEQQQAYLDKQVELAVICGMRASKLFMQAFETGKAQVSLMVDSRNRSAVAVVFQDKGEETAAKLADVLDILDGDNEVSRDIRGLVKEKSMLPSEELQKPHSFFSRVMKFFGV